MFEAQAQLAQYVASYSTFFKTDPASLHSEVCPPSVPVPDAMRMTDSLTHSLTPAVGVILHHDNSQTAMT
jgi:hypothetical protein